MSDGTRIPEVPGYEIVRELGRGGFATVYEARQVSVDRLVALKVVAVTGLDADVERRFRAEISTIGSLSWHPHVVALHDAGLSPTGVPFLAMELVSGGSWADRLAAEGPADAATVIDVGIQVADALGAAHEAGIVHRDVKPDNILIGRRGEALLADFGVATLTDVSRSVSGSFVGTIAYSAPELLRGQHADVRSDVYAVATTLYTLASGTDAFARPGDTTAAAVIARVLYEDPPALPSSVPAPLVGAIRHGMAREPGSRPAGAEALAELLRGARRTLDGPPAAPAPGALPATARPGEVPVTRPGAGETTARDAATPAPPPPTRPMPGAPAGPHPVAPAATPPPSTPFPPAPTGPVPSAPPPTSAELEAHRLASLPPPPRVDPYGPTTTRTPLPPAPPPPIRPTTVSPAPVPTYAPVPVPVPVYEPRPGPQGPAAPPAQQWSPSGVWASAGRALVAMVCCAPISPVFAVQAHRRLLASGGALRARGAKGRVVVLATYVVTVAALLLSIGVPVWTVRQARAATGPFVGTWEGGSATEGDGGLVRVELEQADLGLDLRGSYAVLSGTSSLCQVAIVGATFDGGDATLELDAAACTTPGLVPEQVEAAVEGDELTLGSPVDTTLRPADA